MPKKPFTVYDIYGYTRITGLVFENADDQDAYNMVIGEIGMKVRVIPIAKVSIGKRWALGTADPYTVAVRLLAQARNKHVGATPEAIGQLKRIIRKLKELNMAGVAKKLAPKGADVEELKKAARTAPVAGKAGKGKPAPEPEPEEAEPLTRASVEGMDRDELIELIDEHSLDVDADDKKLKKDDKLLAAVLAALEEEDLLAADADEDDDEDGELTAEAVGEMDRDELIELIEEHSLDVDADDKAFKKDDKLRAAVLQALIDDGVLEEEAEEEPAPAPAPKGKGKGKAAAAPAAAGEKKRGNPEALEKARAARAEGASKMKAMKIKVLNKNHGARDGTFRASMLNDLFAAKTVGEFYEAGEKYDAGCVRWAEKQGYIELR